MKVNFALTDTVPRWQIGCDKTMDVGTIYCLFNKKTEKYYVGQTWRDVQNRWKSHQSKRNSCIALRNSIQKHGKESFTLITLEYAYDQRELDQAEIFWIKLLNSKVPFGYNLNEGCNGKRPSQETRDKISKIWLGRKRGPMSEEQKRKVSEAKKGQIPANKGKKASNETRLKLSIAHTGLQISEATRIKMSLAKLGKKKSKETRARMSIAAKRRMQDAKADN